MHELLGGALRDSIRLYWSHCDTCRVNWPEVHPYPPVTLLADVRLLGREVNDKGFTVLKTNIFLFDRESQAMLLDSTGRAGIPS